jgi:hypothetical protein
VGRVQAALDECLSALRGLPDEAWQQPGVHPRRGSMTVAELTDSFLVHHVEEHAKQIDAALDALRPTKTR